MKIDGIECQLREFPAFAIYIPESFTLARLAVIENIVDSGMERVGKEAVEYIRNNLPVASESAKKA